MSNRIPTTDEVRDAAMNSSNWEEQILPAEFDRWLAEVKAQAWQDGRHAKDTDVNPYRQGEEQ